MKENYTHVTIVLDRSGSMQSVKTEMEQALNDYIEKQKNIVKSPELVEDNKDFIQDIFKDTNSESERQERLPCTVTFVTFDTHIDFEFEGKDLYSITDRLLLTPRGGTALHDAMGTAIDKTGEFLSKIDEANRPGKVILIVITDGEENSSQQYSQKDIADKVKHQQDTYKWQFIFLGTNQDAVLTAKQFNVSANNTLSYTNNSRGIASMSASLSSTSYGTRFRKMASYEQVYADSAFTEEDKEEQEAAAEEPSK